MTPSPSNPVVCVETMDDNQFNLGWLLYTLGEDRPAYDPGDAYGESAAQGWDMGKETGGMLKQVRDVFARQRLAEKPAYRVTINVPVTVNDQNVVVTNVGPDQQGTAQEIAKGHAKAVAKQAGADV